MNQRDMWVWEAVFPVMLIILDVFAAIVYAWHGDVRRFIYWIAAAVLTACVTF